MTEHAHPSPALDEALTSADAALDRLDRALAQLGDGDLHRAHSAGGWTVSQVVSHLSMSTILWLGDLKRLETDPDLDFLLREEVGHDLVGYPQPTIELARRQVASTRRTLATAGAAVHPDVAGRSVTIPDLGTLTVAEWAPLIVGHAAGHVEQAFGIMHDRGFAPEV